MDCLNGMNTQKNRPKKNTPTIFNALFMLNEIVCEYLKTKHISEGKYPSLSASNIKYFRTVNLHHRVFLESLNYQLNDLKKMVCPKDIWMRHWMQMMEKTHFLILQLIQPTRLIVLFRAHS